MTANPPTRRRLLGMAAGAAAMAPAAALATGAGTAQAASKPAAGPALHLGGPDGLPSPSLRELAARRGLLFGTAIHNPAAVGDPRYAAVLRREFSIVSPENVMKWDTVEPEHGLEDYTAAQLIFMPIAHQNQQLVRGHNLVWHAQLPEFIPGSWTNDQLTSMLHNHVTNEVTAIRRSGKIFAWDVVNEPLNEDGTMRQTLWYNAVGPDYIATALQWAHQADPGARLYINDYNLEALGPKSDGMYALIKGLLNRGIPIHGVGFQGHLDIQYPYPQGMPANVQRFADLGIDVAVTEADVRMTLPATPDKLAAQAQYFSQLLADYLTLSKPVSFTMWGFTDAHSWVDGFFTGEGAACILDANYQPKPAYFAMRKVLTG
jgi:endo-1,4-beta-xylanase